MPATRGVLLTTQLDAVKPLKENCLKWMLITTPLLEYLDWMKGDFLVQKIFVSPLWERRFFLGYNSCGRFFFEMYVYKDMKIGNCFFKKVFLKASAEFQS